MNDFAQNIKLIRNHLGLSQREVGWLAGISQSTISLIESGRMIPHNNQIIRLTNFYATAMRDEMNYSQKEPKGFNEAVNPKISFQSRPGDKMKYYMEAQDGTR
jgi:transcriptional regulator with XRE-family HTH domain